MKDHDEAEDDFRKHNQHRDLIFQQRLRIEQLRNGRDGEQLRRAVADLQALIRVQNTSNKQRHKNREI